MALTRIWSAFILIALLVAGIRTASVPGGKGLFSSMVIGKTGDTVRIGTIARSQVDPGIWQATDSGQVYRSGDISLIRKGDQEIFQYRLQF